LKLGSNKIGYEGAEAISESLKVNTSLTSLNLLDNPIGDSGGKFFRESLKFNTTLTTLNLPHKNISIEILQAIKKLLT